MPTRRFQDHQDRLEKMVLMELKDSKAYRELRVLMGLTQRYPVLKALPVHPHTRSRSLKDFQELKPNGSHLSSVRPVQLVLMVPITQAPLSLSLLPRHLRRQLVISGLTRAHDPRTSR